jgi:hypothetical protein
MTERDVCCVQNNMVIQTVESRYMQGETYSRLSTFLILPGLPDMVD